MTFLQFPDCDCFIFTNEAFICKAEIAVIPYYDMIKETDARCLCCHHEALVESCQARKLWFSILILQSLDKPSYAHHRFLDMDFARPKPGQHRLADVRVVPKTIDVFDLDNFLKHISNLFPHALPLWICIEPFDAFMSRFPMLYPLWSLLPFCCPFLAARRSFYFQAFLRSNLFRQGECNHLTLLQEGLSPLDLGHQRCNRWRCWPRLNKINDNLTGQAMLNKSICLCYYGVHRSGFKAVRSS